MRGKDPYFWYAFEAVEEEAEGSGVDAGRDDQTWPHHQRGEDLGEECPQGEVRLPRLHVRPPQVQEERPLVPGRKPFRAKSVQRCKDGVNDVLKPGNMAPWPEVRDKLTSESAGPRCAAGLATSAMARGCRPTGRSTLTNTCGHVSERTRRFLARRHKASGYSYERFPVFGALGVLRLRDIHLDGRRGP